MLPDPDGALPWKGRSPSESRDADFNDMTKCPTGTVPSPRGASRKEKSDGQKNQATALVVRSRPLGRNRRQRGDARDRREHRPVT